MQSDAWAEFLTGLETATVEGRAKWQMDSAGRAVLNRPSGTVIVRGLGRGLQSALFGVGVDVLDGEGVQMDTLPSLIDRMGGHYGTLPHEPKVDELSDLQTLAKSLYTAILASGGGGEQVAKGILDDL
ncbi:hypothetical protein [Aquihabitans sp. McL0605]|uniref:hypothetical protein n=1 Tax=Aquihabitans sp. McL0605 TaxID=3415671 RepID=UPI003CF089C4